MEQYGFIIGLIVFGVVLLLALIVGMILLFKAVRKKVEKSGKTLSFTCEKCGGAFDVPMAYFSQHPSPPRKSVSVKVAGTGGTVKMSRRISCPYCGRKTWCRQNMGQTYDTLGGMFWK